MTDKMHIRKYPYKKEASREFSNAKNPLPSIKGVKSHQIITIPRSSSIYYNLIMSDSISGIFDVPRLEDAVKRDDVESFYNHLSIYPSQLSEPKAHSKLKQNLLTTACHHGSRQIAEKIARDHPNFLRIKDKQGQTPLHIASSKGDFPLVELLVELDSKACLIKDKCSLIPLHIAVKLGYDRIIRTLIGACPQSIQAVTSQKETVFHLAAKHYQSKAFDVLLELTLEFNKHHLLHRKDREGNNILHIAASNKLTGVISKLLLPGQNSISRALVRVNTLNKNRLTALDVYNQSNRDIAMQDIGHILREAGGVEARSLTMRAHIRWTFETKNVILVVLSVITGASFTTVCNLPASFIVKNDNHNIAFGTRDVISGQLPPIFYLMVFNTAILMVCMLAIVVLLWSLPLRPVVVFLTITIAIVYALLVNNIMPRLLVSVGNHILSGGYMVVSLAVGFICIGSILYYCCSCGYQITKRVITKTTQDTETIMLLPSTCNCCKST